MVELADMDLWFDQKAMMGMLARVRCKHGVLEVGTRCSGMLVSIEGCEIPEALLAVRYGSIPWHSLVLRPPLSQIGSVADNLH